MTSNPNFYSVIIGTELLNGRRKDAHFSFLNKELLKRSWNHKASFIIEDDVKLMEKTFELIKADENSVMFCFGGIGSTPDDYTREIAAKVFTNGKMQYHQEAKELIEKQFAKEAYPYRIEMANIPVNAKLLKNVVNNVPGFYLEDRFFFTPGFPSMSQAMVCEALDKYYLKNKIEKFRLTFRAYCGENDLIPIMKKMPSSIELSSLPRIVDNRREVEISLASIDNKLLDYNYKLFIDFIINKNIKYTKNNS